MLVTPNVAKNIEPQEDFESFPTLEFVREPTLSIIVVGASGDLAKKKIFPAIFALYYEGFLPEVLFLRIQIQYIFSFHSLMHSICCCNKNCM